ncbi:hypothetical protein [Pontibacter pamirensis]|uniref:hypothetical protein n=1 Tax=Pontibacter pamirensis TaxID=2562824 RepID=UPI00138A28E5|nr:hypothetical protein [Pontibacter pamirensis]
MKHLCLTPLLFLLILFSCKDVAPTPQIGSQLEGEWVNVSQSYKHYDASGQLVHEERDSTGTLFDFNGYRTTITYGTGTETECVYTLLESNGRNHIQFTWEGLLQTYEITSISDSMMSWSTEAEETECIHQSVKTAERAITTIEFSRL